MMGRCGFASLAVPAVLAWLAGSTLLPCLSAQSIKLSGPLARELRSGDVPSRVFTANGARVVYRADRSAAGVFELFTRPTDLSTPSIRLNGPLPAGADVAEIALGATDRVAYRADQTVQGIAELYSVPADGSASALRLSLPLVHVTRFWLVPAGTHAVFATADTLYRVPLDGSLAPAAIAALGPLGPVGMLWFSPDGARTVVETSAGNGELLHSVPTDGSVPPVLLQQADGPGFFFRDVRFASNGVHVICEQLEAIAGEFFDSRIYGLPVDGSQPASLISSASTFLGTRNFALDGNSALDRVVFEEAGIVYSAAYDGSNRLPLSPAGWTLEFTPIAVVEPAVVFAASNGTTTRLFRAPLDGSLAGVALSTSPLGQLRQVEIHGTRVVYRHFNGNWPIQVVPLAGGTPTLLNPPLVNDRGAKGVFKVHPNGLDLAYLSDVQNSGLIELYATRIDGSISPRKLNAQILPNGDVESFSFPAASKVEYRANSAPTYVYSIFGAPISGSGPVDQYNELGPSNAFDGDVLTFQPTPDGRVVYRADGEQNDVFELFTVGAFGRARAVSLASLPPGSSILPGFVVSGERVLYQVDEPARFSLHSAPTTPGAAPLELDSSTTELPLPLAVSPDGTRAVYRRKGATGATDYALRSAPMDGSSPPITLHPPLPAGRAVTEFQLSPDGQFVVYLADAALNDTFELFSARLDGSSAPVRLHAPLPAFRRVYSYRISPDSANVVFRIERVVGEVELFAAPIDGRLSAQRSSSAITPNRGVVDFAISPNGREVAYRGSTRFLPGSLASTDLFRVPIRGHRALRRSSGEFNDGAVRLTKLPPGRGVESDYSFSADGTAVFYRANPNVAVTDELFRVAADGSSPPVPLSGALAPNRTVSSFALGQNEAVFVADAIANDVFELFRVPLAGGPAVRLDALPPFADVSSFRIDPLSKRVVYQADRESDGQLDLFAIPLDGSAPPERLNGDLPASGDVEADYLPLPGGRVLYRADQGTNDVVELFVALGHKLFPK